MKEVRIESDHLISDQIWYDKISNTISFKGDEIKDFTSETIAHIKITLVNGAGENPFSQTVFVLPSQDPSV